VQLAGAPPSDVSELVGHRINLGWGSRPVQHFEVVSSHRDVLTVVWRDRSGPAVVVTEVHESLAPGAELAIGWVDGGGFVQLDCVVVAWSSDDELDLRCGWPPSRVERRQSFRVRSSLAMAAAVFSEPLHVVHGTSVDLGLGGLCAALDGEPRLGARAALVVWLPNGAPCQIPATVIGSRPGRRRVAFRFDELSRHDDALLSSHIAVESARLIR
jgi:hypothetical protein